MHGQRNKFRRRSLQHGRLHYLCKKTGTVSKELILTALIVVCACIISVASNYYTTKATQESSLASLKATQESNKTLLKIAQESNQTKQNEELWNRARYVMDKKIPLASEVMELCSLAGIHIRINDINKTVREFVIHKKTLNEKSFQLATLGTDKQRKIAQKIPTIMDDVGQEIYDAHQKFMANYPDMSQEDIDSNFSSIRYAAHKKLTDISHELSNAIREDFLLFQQQTELGHKELLTKETP